MKCVYFDDRQPNGFEEQFEFSAQMPYTLCVKHFPSEDVVPLHYADTVEILLCDQLSGQIVIDDQQFELGGRQLFVIPPYILHANDIRPGGGVMYVMKVSLTDAAHYINLPNILELSGCQIGQLQYACPEYEDAAEIMHALIEHDGDLPLCLTRILDLFRLFARHIAPERRSAGPGSKFRESSLQELIAWTQENYARHITIDDAAKLTGYSKYHFCSRFKSLTGTTYLNYLNSVRISHACLMLRDGQSVQKVCRESGFESVSYFIQVFKRIHHITPHQYACALEGQKYPPEPPLRKQ